MSVHTCPTNVGSCVWVTPAWGKVGFKIVESPHMETMAFGYCFFLSEKDLLLMLILPHFH